MKKYISPILLLVAFTTKVFAQQTEPFDYKLKIIPLPAIAYSPNNGWMFGVAPGATWYLGNPDNTSISSALGSLIYTTKKQWIITAKTTTFFAGDRSILNTDMRYFITSQPTFGLGTGPQSAKIAGSLSPSNLEIDDNENKTIKRTSPFSTSVMGSYQVFPHWSLQLGVGGEFAKEENFLLTRIGIEYGWEIPGNFEVSGILNYDLKWNAYNSCM